MRHCVFAWADVVTRKSQRHILTVSANKGHQTPRDYIGGGGGGDSVCVGVEGVGD
jgi:hypothetical protein